MAAGCLHGAGLPTAKRFRERSRTSLQTFKGISRSSRAVPILRAAARNDESRKGASIH